MRGKIFVNYRRDDSAANALAIASYLERAFGGARVFIDVDRLRAGQNFPQELEKRLSECAVMVCLIGPGWLDARNEEGARRRDDPKDWVRLEIERALARGLTVIPVLVEGACLPKAGNLPDTLKPLVELHAVSIATNSFRSDMAGLTRDIHEIASGAPWRWIGAGAGASALAAAAIFALSPHGATPTPTPHLQETPGSSATIEDQPEEAVDIVVHDGNAPAEPRRSAAEERKHAEAIKLKVSGDKYREKQDHDRAIEDYNRAINLVDRI